MKQLTQAVFEGAPDWVKSAAIDSDGSVWRYNCKKHDLFSCLNRGCYKSKFIPTPSNFKSECIGRGEAADWQNSAIDREVN